MELWWGLGELWWSLVGDEIKGFDERDVCVEAVDTNLKDC